MSQDSTVSVVTRLLVGQLRKHCLICDWGERFSSFQNVQTGYKVRPASYSVGCKNTFPVGKAAGLEVDNSSSSSTKVENEWSCTSTAIYAIELWDGWMVRVRSLYLYQLYAGQWSRCTKPPIPPP
jgi:hypothetical protein